MKRPSGWRYFAQDSTCSHVGKYPLYNEKVQTRDSFVMRTLEMLVSIDVHES